MTQPWAALVALGLKRVENRSRPMIRSADFGKPFAIHASREIDESVYDRIEELAPELRLLPSIRTSTSLASVSAPMWYRLSRVTSAVIGVAAVEDAVMIGGCTPEVIAKICGDRGMPDQARWMFGPTAYLTRDNRAIATPVPCRGWQGFWTLPADVERAVTAQLR